MDSLKSFKPVTASLRGTILLNRGVDDVKPFKALTVGKKSTGGRDGYGHITSRRRGGGAKRKYRIVSFKKTIFDSKAVIQSIEYDPNRTANIALLKYENGSFEYSIAISGMVSGDTVITSSKADVLPGNTIPLSFIPIGTIVSSVELIPGGGSKIARAAGTSVVIVGKEDGMVMLKMPSNKKSA
jgi:large subunit ribosomal protein L2